MENDLEPYENVTRVFWIKIELQDLPSKQLQLYGDIRDVMSGARSPVFDLLDIINFIIPYLQQMGVRISWFWRLAIWMKKKGKFIQKNL